MRWISFLFAVFLLSGTVVAEEEFRARNRAVIDDHVIPGYQRFAIAIKPLQTSTEALCAAPSSEALKIAQGSFSRTMLAWQGVQHIRFGPVEQENRLFRISFWPDRKNFTGRQLRAVLATADPKLLESNGLQVSSVAIQGFMALERLLFADAPARESGYACDFAAAITVNLSEMADEIVTEWSGPKGWRSVMLTPGPDNPVYQNDKEVTLEIFKALGAGLVVLKDQKLLSVIGNAGRQPKPKRAEAWRSQSSLENIRASLAALNELLQIGYRDILENNNGGDGTEAIAQVMREANLALDNIDHALPQAVHNDEDRKWLNYLLFQISTAQDVVAGEIVPALDLPLSFNALDGD